MNLPAKHMVYGSLLCFGMIFVSGCSPTSEKNQAIRSTSVENEAIRANNCALIADWNVYTNDPSTAYFQGKLNTYQTEGEMEDRLWQKMQTGDKSYDVLTELRKLRYSENLWNAPPLGEKVTQENADSFRVKGDSIYGEKASWKIIENVRTSCSTFPKEYLADLFAPSLNL